MRASLLCLLLMGLAQAAPAGVLRAGFVVTPGVFNSELMAPYDVLEHTRYRDENDYVACFVIAQTMEPLRTAEGIWITPHHSFADAPELDIVIIPSGEHSMDSDLENGAYVAYLEKVIAGADWVISLCDGAFPFAATGALNGRIATTFPGDRDAFAARFPEIDVRYDVRFVVDGRFITSVGGAPSYEPAFWLVDHLYGSEHAARTAQGLVFDWDPGMLPHLVVGADSH